MTVTEATYVQRLIDAVMQMRDQPLARTNAICTDRLCHSLIVLADRSQKAMRDCPTSYLADWSGDKVRRAWPKPADWTLKERVA